MKKNLLTAIWFTLVTTVLCGLIYPLAVTGLAHFLFPRRADGQPVVRNGQIIGSRIIGQKFTGPEYFHSRPSAAGSGYDPLESGGSNLGPTNRVLIQRVEKRVREWRVRNPGAPIPADLVMGSGSGLDPDISPAAAEFQVSMIARARSVSASAIESLVRQHIEGRQFGLLGEPRVNVLELNLALDRLYPLRPRARASRAARARSAARTGNQPTAR